MFLKIAFLFTAVLVSYSSFAQKFVPRSAGASKTKTAYVFKSDGEKIVCTIKSLKWKKGLIDEIKILDLKGKKIKISPDDISHMYLPPRGLEKLANAMDFLGDPSQWGETDLDKDLLGQKLVYYEQSMVKVKKKTYNVMVQVLNPTFCKKLRVYNDPYAKETASLGVGGVTVAGGDAKSYYVKKVGDPAAYKLEKKNYSEEFKVIFSDCPELLEKYGDDPKWKDFEMHVWEYSQMCSGE